jgi:hypothetical protein
VGTETAMDEKSLDVVRELARCWESGPPSLEKMKHLRNMAVDALTEPAPWTCFGPAWFTDDQMEQMRALALQHGLPPNVVIADRVYRNSRYQVNVWDSHPDLPDGKIFPKMIWLSIKRLDREPIHDWRELQRIKDEIVGKNHEAVELYPARSRLVDTSNQYHLFVLADPATRFPFGWTSSLVSSAEDAAQLGAKQRPIEAQPPTYRVAFPDHLLEELDALGIEETELTRGGWIGVAERAIGKAARVRKGDYGGPDEDCDIEAWAADLEQIADIVFAEFKPGDGKI